MTKKSVLFVDDEPNILSGLRRMLRSLRNEIEMHFVESGFDALAFMAENNVDIIVSDMRMPGMDGATLLATAQEKYPHVIRIMLTGQANEEAVLRTVGVAHQFLAKPSSAETLKEVLGRAGALQSLLRNEQLKSVIAKIGKLPSLPAVYAELQRELKKPECALVDIAKIIEKDLAMSTKVLQLVNSAFFGFFTHIDSPVRAVNLLGLDTIKALVLGVGVFTEFKEAPNSYFSIQELWRHSFAVAAYAKKIAEAESDLKECIEDSFIAGLLHDIGKLLFYSSFHKEYEEAIKLTETKKMQVYHAEQEIFSADHADAGGYLVGLWGMPGAVIEAVSFHHRLDSYPSPSFCPALAVHAADIIYHRLNPGHLFQAPTPSLYFFEQAGVADSFEDWLEMCREIQLE